MTASDSVSQSGTAAAAGRSSLPERLLRRAHVFDFFQAVWLLERYHGGQTPVGQRGPVASEKLRFRPDLSLAFPATDLRRITIRKDPERDELSYLLEITFLGLYGVATPLPLHYAVDILRAAEPAGGVSPVRDFLDLFHHRLISLFYRAWLKYHYERMFAAPQRDVITDYLRLLCGLPPGAGPADLGVSPVRLLRYAGVWTQHPRSAATLAGLLHDFWDGVPVSVQQMVGQWVPLAEADQNRFGLVNCRLGVDLTVGEQVYDLAGALRVCIGPLDWQTYLSFVPGGFRFLQTRALVKLYCCDPLAFSLELRLQAGEVPELQLTSGAGAAALGLTTWVRTQEARETVVIFESNAECRMQNAQGASDREGLGLAA